MTETKLKGKRIAIIAADMVEQVELVEPRKALEAGRRRDRADLDGARLHPGLRPLRQGGHRTRSTARRGGATRPTTTALLIPGGVGNPDLMRGDENMVAFAHAFFEQGKPVAAICHGPWMLVEAGVVRGRKLTSWPTLETDIGTPAATGSTAGRRGRRAS